MNAEERNARHSRQLRMREIGPEGQSRLAEARVLVVGVGGLGAPVVEQLAAAGTGGFTLVDDDIVERSNLNRQVLHRERDLGRKKVERAAEWVRELDPVLVVDARTFRVTTDNARELVRGHDIVLDCTDGLPSKFLLNDACVLEDVPLVHGAATGLFGQTLFIPGHCGPCLRCLFEGVPPPGTVPTCQQAGVLASTLGFVGSLMALEAIKHLTGLGGGTGRFLVVDAGTPSLRAVALERRADCAACGDEPEVDARTPDDYLPGAP